MPVIRLFLLPLLLVLGSCATVLPPTEAPAKEEAFVVAANPIAARAGMEVLERGGSAADAAVAVEAMLSLVEPQSSGLGGGGFMTYFDASSGKVTIYDGRETAPAQASPSMFLDSTGRPLPFAQAVLSGRATGVPGAVALLAEAHRDHGNLRWSDLFDAARQTAEDGFIVSPRLARMIAGDFPQNAAPDVRAYFARAGGGLLKAGDRLRNPAYAAFLDRLASEGPSAFYAGSTAAKIIGRTRAAPLGGSMTMADLASYRPIKRNPVCRPYRVYLVCAPPPPSSGVGMLALLGMLEKTDIARRGPVDPQAWFLFAEASRLMYADRDQFVGDPAFVRVPVQGMVDSDYLTERAQLIGQQAMPAPKPGNPAGAPALAADRTYEPAGTTHFIVRDGRGNVVSMTATVESIFGAGRMVDGFFLNNQLTDFAFSPVDSAGRPQANAVAPGKRPRSSMTPLILLDRQGHFAGAIGSAGGNAILAYVAKSLVAAIDWGLPMQDALAAPNLVARGSNFNGEATKFAPGVLEALAARGMTVKPGQGEDSGVHAVLIRDGKVDGGFDPRREGVVLVKPRG
ncbi:gamma-glutamyltransferase [Sphingomonas edaphi]|uniref:Glutathione hydrolase proenzyme n=1 Tax=Sphingomonas edaphi TaxID=2315689 RepID=A0A418Q3B3_9SPHN|nr:gamma-glutamyltransferase [Sphingomonas edaphi]RIX32396.1 gamma-glutamyltransferase [Sphingomonas edaphi]